MALGSRAFAVKRSAIILIVVMIVAVAGYWYITRVPPEAPSKELLGVPSEEVLDLNGAWKFKPDFDESDWTIVTVPHTWNTMPGLEDFQGNAWYLRIFSVPAHWYGSCLRLKFDATFYLSKVWLNGKYLGGHEGGYTPYLFDVTDKINYGGNNVVIVMVNNVRDYDRIPAQLWSGWSYDWWHYGGIVRDVYILATNKIFIHSQRIVSVPDLVDSADIDVKVTVNNSSPSKAKVTVKAWIYDEATGDLVWGPEDDSNLQSTLTISAKSFREFSLTTTMPDPKPWHFDHPNLYILTTKVIDEDGNVLHSLSDNFGIRKIELKDARFYLNGEWVRLVGMTRHEDSPQYGLAESYAIMSSDYDDIKRANVVVTRPVHYPQHDYIMDYADRNGILLIPEVPAWQLSRAHMSNPKILILHKQMLREMIEKDFNHPSVWAWSLANEIESDTPEGRQFIKEAYDYVKSLDPTKYVSFASNKLYQFNDLDADATRFCDFVMMNEYYGSWVQGDFALALDRIHEAWPDKMIVISEFGFEEKFAETSEEADLIRQRIIREHLDIMREMDYVGGAIFWCYQDYKTPTGFKMGVVDEYRNHRHSYNVLRKEYSPVNFESITHSIFELIAGQEVTTEASLKTRGPVAIDMPAYTLEGYTLHWKILDETQGIVLDKGDIDIPSLPPGSTWEGSFSWTMPQIDNFVLKLEVIRPTGFVCIESTVSVM